MADYSLRVQFFVSGTLISGSHSAQGSRSRYLVPLFSPLLWSKINRICLCAGDRLD